MHAVQTSTPALAEILRREIRKSRCFPMPSGSCRKRAISRETERLTVFFGALNREQDWPPFIPALNAVAKAAGERLRSSSCMTRRSSMRCETPHKKFMPTCDYDAYLALLGNARFRFMPLADTEFNRAKSDLKFIEAGASRVASLASHTVYAASIEDGRTGILFRDPEELATGCCGSSPCPTSPAASRDAARAHVAAKRMLAYQVAGRIAWYRSLWARRVELTRALVGRVPELERAGATHLAPGETVGG